MIRTKLRQIRQGIYAYLDKGERIGRHVLREYGDWMEEAAERITFLETEMRTKQQAIDALIAGFRAEKQKTADLQLENDSLKQRLANGPAATDLITDAEVAAANELAPEPAAPVLPVTEEKAPADPAAAK